MEAECLPCSPRKSIYCRVSQDLLDVSRVALFGLLSERRQQRREVDPEDGTQRSTHVGLCDVHKLMNDFEHRAARRDALIQCLEQGFGARLKRRAAVAVAHDRVPFGQLGLGFDNVLSSLSEFGFEDLGID